MKLLHEIENWGTEIQELHSIGQKMCVASASCVYKTAGYAAVLCNPGGQHGTLRLFHKDGKVPSVGFYVVYRHAEYTNAEYVI